MNWGSFEKVYDHLLDDKRLTAGHISFYTALVLLWEKSGQHGSFPVSRKIIMKLSHINSIATYHKYLHQLIEYGYLQYYPCFDYYKKSQIKLVHFIPGE